MADSNPSSSASDLNEAAVKEDIPEEPLAKKMKLETAEQKSSSAEKLEQRLGGILCCAVCLDLPKTAIYQCTNGHLMCAGCFNHLMADARLRDETATCPNCRVDISKTTVSRNLAVEKALSELPSECQFCGEEYPRNSITKHEQIQCEERATVCQYSRIGCPWQGPFHEREEHERNCTHPHNTGAQVLQALDLIEQSKKEEKHLYESLLELLSFEKLMFNDLQLKPYRTEEFIHKLYYETLRFQGIDNLQFVVKARINNSQRDPALSCEREISYQIILKTRTPQPISISYMILRGPFSDFKISPKIYKFDFTESENEAPYTKLPLVDTAECNRLLSKKVIDLRLIMFLHQK